METLGRCLAPCCRATGGAAGLTGPVSCIEASHLRGPSGFWSAAADPCLLPAAGRGASMTKRVSRCGQGGTQARWPAWCWPRCMSWRHSTTHSGEAVVGRAQVPWRAGHLGPELGNSLAACLASGIQLPGHRASGHMPAWRHAGQRLLGRAIAAGARLAQPACTAQPACSGRARLRL